jgi:hypothetical protein
MRATTLLAMLAITIILLLFQIVWLADIVLLAIIVLILFSVVSNAAGFSKKAYTSLSKGIVDDAEKAKGQSPKAISEIGKMLEAVGAKTGETAWSNPKLTNKSTNLIERLGTASKNLLDGMGRLMK